MRESLAGFASALDAVNQHLRSADLEKHASETRARLQEASVGMHTIENDDNLAPQALDRAPFALGRSLWDDLEHDLPQRDDLEHDLPSADAVGFDAPSLPCALSGSTSESEDTDTDGPWFDAASCLPGPALPVSSIDLAVSETYDHRWASVGLNFLAPITTCGGWR